MLLCLFDGLAHQALTIVSQYLWPFFLKKKKKVSARIESMHHRTKKGLPLGGHGVGVIKGRFRKQLQSFFLMCIRTIDIVFCCASWFDYFSRFDYGVSCWLFNIHLFLSMASHHFCCLTTRLGLLSSFFHIFLPGT